MLASVRVVVCLVAGVGLGACAREPDARDESRSLAARETSTSPARAGDAAARKPSEPAPAPGPPKRIFAKKFVAKIRSAPDKAASRIGYLRGGAVLQAKTAAPIGKQACRLGWYELETGGFVCSTTDVVAFDGPRLPDRRPLQPDRSARLPYPYGYSRQKGTPVYRRLPTDAALAELVASPQKPAGTGPAADAGSLLEPPAAGMAGEGEESTDAGVPTLASLQGGADSLLLRRMERGFYVSLDEESREGGGRYWRTQANGFIPFDRLLLVKGSEFRGVHLEPGAMQLPLGFVSSSKHSLYRRNAKGKLRPALKPGYHHVFEIAGEEEVNATAYYVTATGDYFRSRDAIRVAAREKPSEVGADERWIDVDLATQSLVAYVGERPVFATLVSTGRVEEKDDPLEDFATPTGSFRIAAKHLTTTMDGDHAIDGPYSIEDVPYVMFFEGAYALHSAFWHNAFGRPRSHGCINLAPEDARWLFDWTNPALPPAWHGVFPSEATPGTRIYVHGETPEE